MARKHAGPMGAPCAGCGKYLTMRDATQRKAAHSHRVSCRAYQEYLNTQRELDAKAVAAS